MLRRAGAGTGAFGAVGLALLLVGCVAAPPPDSPTKHLPLGIPEPMVAQCEQGAGLGGSAPVTEIWRDSIGVHVRVGAPGARPNTGVLSATEAQLLSCLDLVGGSLPPYPRDAGGLLLQWKYSTSVLWPCFVAHDLDPGPTPTRAVFLDGDPLKIDPFSRLQTPLSQARYLDVQRDCPLIPTYLATSTAE